MTNERTEWKATQRNPNTLRILILGTFVIWAIILPSIAYRWYNPPPPVIRVEIQPMPIRPTDLYVAFYLGEAHDSQIEVDRVWLNDQGVGAGGSVIGAGLARSYRTHALMVVGSMDYREQILKGTVPPRCRNVPKGAGCIDWLEPGDKDWNTVLKSRPAGPGKGK